jgi:hypothetical protein
MRFFGRDASPSACARVALITMSHFFAASFVFARGDRCAPANG